MTYVTSFDVGQYWWFWCWANIWLAAQRNRNTFLALIIQVDMTFYYAKKRERGRDWMWWLSDWSTLSLVDKAPHICVEFSPASQLSKAQNLLRSCLDVPPFFKSTLNNLASSGILQFASVENFEKSASSGILQLSSFLYWTFSDIFSLLI